MLYYLIRRIQTDKSSNPLFQVVSCGSTYDQVAEHQAMAEKAVPPLDAVSYFIHQYDHDVTGRELTEKFISSQRAEKRRLAAEVKQAGIEAQRKQSKYSKSFMENYEEYLDPDFNEPDALEAF
jgi:hypothetical protein